jgi:parallel beta-helix repeat protein
MATGDRVTVRHCQIRNINFGISMTGAGSRVECNTIDGFCGDGMRGLGDDEVFEYNLVKNRRDVNANHPDGFQSWSLGSGGVGTGVVRNITLRGNTFIAYEDPAIPFAGTLQGIGCFDGIYEGWIVENNVILTDHWHGISLYGARGCRIVNNTVLDLNSVEPGPPWIMVTAHKNGTASQNCIVRNNLSTALNLDDGAATADHNLILPADPAPYFVDLAHQDVRLSPGSPALDMGSLAQAPALDADGNARPQGAAIDVGAYERMP